MGRRSPGLVAAALVIAAAAGQACSALDELNQLQDRIERRGYDVSSTFHEDFGSDRNEVEVIAEQNRGEAGLEGQTEIAGIVWDSYPRRFDSVVVELDDDAIRFSRGSLQERFGPRPASLDEKEFGDDVRSGIRGVAIAGVVFVGLGIVAIVATVVVLRRRSKRPPPPPSPGAPLPPYGSGGWRPPPPPPAPPPGWTPPQS